MVAGLSDARQHIALSCKPDHLPNALETMNMKRLVQSSLKQTSGLKFLLFIYSICFVNLLIMKLLAPDGSLTSSTCQLDCFWYTDIIRNGYATHPLLDDSLRMTQANWAFFPLYPMLSYAFHRLLSVSALHSALLVNIILWPVLIYLMYRDLLQRNIQLNPILYTLFMVLFPFNIWYTSQYSEGTFSLLLVCIFMALRQKRIVLAALFCCLISLSRPTGFLSVLFITAWLFCHDLYKNRRSPSFTMLADSLQKNLFLISAAGCGLSLYVLYLFHITGDGFAFSHIQIAWLRKFNWLPVQIINALPQKHERIFVIYLAAASFVLYKMFRKGWKLESCLMAFILLIATSTKLISVERFIFSNPFVMEFLAVAFATLSVRKQRVGLFCLFILHLIVIRLWFHGKYWFI